MGYSIYLNDPVSKEPVQFYEKHQIHGGNMILGGTTEAWLHITYNYSNNFKKAFGNEEGVEIIYGKTGAESIPLLKSAIEKLGDDVSTSYWDSTEGNAKRALCGLLAYAQLRPDGIWSGD